MSDTVCHSQISIKDHGIKMKQSLALMFERNGFCDWNHDKPQYLIIILHLPLVNKARVFSTQPKT